NAISFAWMTMGTCIATAVEIAEQLAVDETAQLWYRCSAMFYLILISRENGNLNYIAIIKELLTSNINDESDCRELIKLLLKVLDDRELWNASKSEIYSA